MLSVIVVNWNTREELRSCLGSLRRFPYSGEMEVLVVDNQSSDGSADLVASEFPEVRLLCAGGNTGYARGNNLGFSHAGGGWILTLNPDTEVHAETLDSAVRKLRERPEAGSLGARLVGLDGVTQPSVRGFPTLLGVLFDVTGLGKIASAGDTYRLRRFDYRREQWAEQPMGTFLLFRREALPEPRAPFDESFPIFFNEVDLLRRMADAGWKCLYAPEVVVTHRGGASTRQVRKAMIWESHLSLLRYLHKHQRGGRWLLPAVALAVRISALVRAKGWSEGFRPERGDLQLEHERGPS